jgi:hypothetical protein
MTLVPNWLAVLVVLAAPVSARAGIGWRVARVDRRRARTAQRNAALARQDEQRRWNRERQERAYSS